MSNKPLPNININSDGSLHISNQGPTLPNGSWGRVSYDLNNNNEILNQHVTGYSPLTGKTIQDVPVNNQNMGDVVRNIFNLPK